MAHRVDRYIGLCAACMRSFVVQPDRQGTLRLVHHGYQRPGYGYIVGDCPGVGYEPHEVSPHLAQVMLDRLQLERDTTQYELRELPNKTELVFIEHQYDRSRGHIDVPRTIHPGEVLEVRAEYRPRTFESTMEETRRKLQLQLDLLERGIEDYTKLIAEWKPQPLTEESEIVERKAAAAKTAWESRQAKRDAEVQRKIGYYRKLLPKKITDLARAKNAEEAYSAAYDMLHLYEQAWGGIAKASGWVLKQPDAQLLLGFGDIWKSMGVEEPIVDEAWVHAYREAMWRAEGRR